MDRILLTIFFVLVSYPVSAHDFGAIANLMGMAILSFALSIYIVGNGKRLILTIGLVILWAIAWSIMYYGESAMYWLFGFGGLMVVQPIAALIYKKVGSKIA